MRAVVPAVFLLACTFGAFAQQTTGRGGTEAAVLPEFLIGPEDVLSVSFWRDKDMSGDVVVRPDGMITLPLLGDVRAAGLTPGALTSAVQTLAGKYITDPNVTVTVRQINSRKVYITGLVKAPGAYPLSGPRTVVQAIALAGGVLEYAKIDEITVLREGASGTRAFRFNYKDVTRGQSLEQNFELQPGDTIVVP